MQLSFTEEKHLRIADALICLPFLIIPLFLNLPYRVNIFLSWEGAYRLYLGQMPFRDFGLPMGYGYWLIPALFFKIFGPTFLSLIKAQVFINLLSVLSLRGILYNLKVKPLWITLSLLVFCLTYVIYHFWPWYNHSVVVFELCSLYFLTRYLAADAGRSRIWNVVAAGSLAFLSFFTKQDAGALCFLIGVALLIYASIMDRKFMPLVVYVSSFFIVAAAVILPLIHYDFLYWFNFGQAPHDPRFGIGKFADALLGGETQWEKIYLAAIVLTLVIGGRERWITILKTRELFILTFITLAFIGQAIVIRVTSPLPGDHLPFFHAFAVVTLVMLSGVAAKISEPKVVLTAAVIAIIAFSGGYWKYVQGFLGITTSIARGTPVVRAPWTPTGLRGFDNVLLPRETAEGLKRLIHYSGTKHAPKVLNMTELTPLALEMNYQPLTNQPLWYHLNIGIFQKEVDELCLKVSREEYDVVLFEDIPDLTHFYPYQVRDSLRKYYYLNDTFMAPRRGENSTIEVYVRKEALTSMSLVAAK